MANILHRTTLEHRVSVNTPEYPDPPWLEAPNLSAVQGVDQKYWKISGDVVSEMTVTEKNAVDLAELTASRDAVAAKLDRVEDELRAFALTLLDEINLHAAAITAILDAADNANNLGSFKTAMGAINDVPQRTVGQLKTALRNHLGS